MNGSIITKLDGIMHVEWSALPDLADWLSAVGLRVCVTGGRDIVDLGYVWSMLDTLHNLPKEIGGRGPIIELGAGCATGVDDLALSWAEHNSVHWRKYVADWDRYGNDAGCIRNGVMLEDFHPDLLVVYDGNRGTTDCARKARKLEIERMFHTRNGDDPFAEAQRWG